MTRAKPPREFVRSEEQAYLPSPLLHNSSSNVHEASNAVERSFHG